MRFLSERFALDFLNSRFVAGPGPVEKDVFYARGSDRRLDVYAPPAAAGAPVVLFLHGGAWQTGAKEDDRFIASALARRGLVTVAADYGLYPQVRYPAFLRDAAKAVAWIKAHAPRFGGDLDRIILLGHSAGAYIAAMLALDARWLAEAGLDPRRDVAGFVGLAGAYDFLPLRSPALKAIFGAPQDWPLTQPIAYARGDAPPMLLATGRRDRVVDPGNSLRLAARVRALGGEAEVVVYPGLSHSGILAAFARPFRLLAPVLDDVTRFAMRELHSPEARD